MSTIVASRVGVPALLLAALAAAMGCADSGSSENGLVTDPDAASDPDATDPDALSGVDQTQSSDLPLTSRAFLEFPEHAADAAHSPALLSETGAFLNLTALEAAAGLIPYQVQAPLWSDGAHKRRWLSVPQGGTIEFSAAGQWRFPEGTVFVKDFSMALDERRPDELRHLETRFWIAARAGEFYGAVYKWDEDQKDAQLLLEGATEELRITGSDGSERTQTYSYPSTASCRSCHSDTSGPVRGVRTVQLNGARGSATLSARAELPSNQLAAWEALGLFEDPIGDPTRYGHLTPIADEAAPLEDRVRSYWDSNCSMCHNDSPGSPSWDARYQVPLDEQKVLMALPLSGPGPDDLRLIYPGEPDRSLLFRRVNSAPPGTRMPPLLHNRIDDPYVDVLRRWILDLPQQ